MYEPKPPGVFSQVWDIDGVHLGYCLLPDGTATFSFAGSQNAHDWLEDFEAVPYGHPQLGTLHAGFWSGMQDTFNGCKELLSATTGKIAIQGHSLGGAHASIFAALCIVNGIKVEQLTLFASPRPGYRTIRDIIQQHIPNLVAYQNGKWPFRDPVPDVPEQVMGFMWMPTIDVTSVCVRPDGLAMFNPFEYHMIGWYEEAMRRIAAQNPL